MSEVILQEKRTLDDVLISSVNTFRNGCNFRLRKEYGNYFLEYGCYGVHDNLTVGDERLLWLWLKESGVRKRSISGLVRPETIQHLLRQDPCKLCGGAIVMIPRGAGHK